jgi:glyoxylase-like metal-dependent hydrolase (beta-lactamase superfamily II)
MPDLSGMKTPLLFSALAMAIMTPVASTAATESSVVRLYTLDCGHLDLDDMGLFDDAHAGQRGEMAVPCYLIRDGGRWLLWDTGLGDALAVLPRGKHVLGGQWTVRHALAAQLAELGLKPGDIDFVGLSHLHADHSGNIGLFTRSTILLGAAELDWAQGGGIGTDPAIVAAVAQEHVRPVGDDEDIFGDGRVHMFATPGHTPGHHSLLINLPNSGALLLSGDLYHTRENLEKGIVPRVNVSRTDTLASFARFRRLANNLHARMIVQHAPEDFASMPRFPAFLD